MLDQLSEVIKKHKNKTDYLEIRVEEKEITTISFQGKEIENVSQPNSFGGCVRALQKGGWGFVSFNSLENLDKKIDQAILYAKLVGTEKSQLAKAEPVTDEVKAKFISDPRKISLSEKVKLVEGYNTIILKYSPLISNSYLIYAESHPKKYFVNSEGTTLFQEQPHMDLYMRAIAKNKEGIQICSKRFGSRDDFSAFWKKEQDAFEIAKTACDLLKASKVKGGIYTVVLGPAMSGLLAHEGFGHLSEADFVYEDQKLQKIMKLERKFGPKILNIIDDPTLNEYGKRIYDDEGVKTKKTYLIKEGILVGRLHSRETAAKMKEKPTGNAIALNYQFPPIVRMTNTYIKPGSKTLKELIKDIKLGILTRKWRAGQTNNELFTFTAGWGIMIRDGKLAEKVRDVKLTGNLFETLKNIEGINADLEFESGGCGKKYQVGLPTASGGPYVRVKNVIVAGN